MVANPTPPSDSLQILITPDPASAAQPACTPELAALLFQRWPDAMIVFDQATAQRWRWLYLPDLRRRRLARRAAERVTSFVPPSSARGQRR
ncbi:MAG: hypothetical protein ACRDYA_21980 [Egibacteraceae bacterium]